MSFVSSNKLFSIPQRIFRYNGETLKTEPSSKYSHYAVLALGSYRNSPFVTGSDSLRNGLKTEILDYDAGQWNDAKDYPLKYTSNGDRYIFTIIFYHISCKYWLQVNFDSFGLILYFRITRYAATSTDTSVYIIGGFTNGSPSRSTTIAKYSDGFWSEPGSLKQGRYAHGAITIEGKTMIIGGWYGTSGT